VRRVRERCSEWKNALVIELRSKSPLIVKVNTTWWKQRLSVRQSTEPFRYSSLVKDDKSGLTFLSVSWWRKQMRSGYNWEPPFRSVRVKQRRPNQPSLGGASANSAVAAHFWNLRPRLCVRDHYQWSSWGDAGRQEP